MFRRHFFLVIAILLIVAMGVAAGFKLLAGKAGGGQGGPGGQQAAQGGGPGGGRGGPGGPGGPGGGRGGRGGPTLVGAVPVVHRAFADRVEVLGVAKGRESVTLTSNQAEMVTAVRFRPGQKVSKGQVLLDLKAEEEDAQVLQAQAVVNQAKSDADRWATLAAKGFAPQATVEQYKSAYATAQANLRAAQARRSDRVIRAPFSGTVGLSDIAPGALISPGTAIATLDDTSVIHVDFDVPDRFLPFVREGLPIVARSDAYPDIQQAGVIARIDTRIDERTRSVKARAEFKNPSGKIKPGMLMRVGIERGDRTSMAVPESAVQFSGDSSFVYVINPRPAGQGAPAGRGQAAGGDRAAGPAPSGPPAGARAGAPSGNGGGANGGPRVPAPPCTALLANVENSIGASGGANGKTGAAGNAPATNAAANGAPGGQGRRGGAQGRPGQAEQRPVLAGLIEGGYVEIRDGLRSDEIIVSDGLNKMQPGQPVNFCAAQLPQSAAAGPDAGRAGMGGRAGAGGRGGGAGTAGPGALGRPGGQSGGGSRQGRQGVPTVGAPVGRIAGASS